MLFCYYNNTNNTIIILLSNRHKCTGGLLPALPERLDTTNMTLRIDKIGAKDAGTYVDPVVRVSIKGSIRTIEKTHKELLPAVTIG